MTVTSEKSPVPVQRFLDRYPSLESLPRHYRDLGVTLDQVHRAALATHADGYGLRDSHVLRVAGELARTETPEATRAWQAMLTWLTATYKTGIELDGLVATQDGSTLVLTGNRWNANSFFWRRWRSPLTEALTNVTEAQNFERIRVENADEVIA